MKFLYALLGLICLCNVTFSQVNSTALKQAKHAMATKNYTNAISFGLIDMAAHPSKYTAYLIAYAYFITNDFKNAATYAGISTSDHLIPSGQSLNNVQNDQLKQIIDYYAQLNNFNTQQTMNNLYAHYQHRESIFANFALSVPTTTHDVDLQRAHIQQNRNDSALTSRHVSLIDMAGIPEPNTPERVRNYLNSFLNSESHIFMIYWTDSTQNLNSTTAIQTYPIKITNFSPQDFPELYGKRQVLIPDFIPVYIAFQGGNINTVDPIVQRYSLNKYNIKEFYREVFPEIDEKKDTLPAFLKQFAWE